MSTKARPVTVIYSEYNVDNPNYFTVHYRHVFVRELCYDVVAKAAKIDASTIIQVFYGHCEPIKTV